MKELKLQKIELGRLYFYTIVGVLISIFIFILIVKLVIIIFPKFDSIALLLLFYSLIIGSFIYNYSYKKSSSEIKIQIRTNKIIIGNKEVLMQDIKKVKLKKGVFVHYPLITIYLQNNEKLEIRVSKNEEDDLKFLEHKLSS